VAIDSFTVNLRVSVRDQAQALLGADLSLSSRQPLTTHAAAVADTLARGGAIARVTGFGAMAYVPRTRGTRLVQVTAVDGGYPFYGAIRTAPAGAWRALQTGRNVVVEPSLLTALGARLGDTLALGDGRFTIIGTVVSVPGDIGIRAAFGARVWIPGRDVGETGLIGFGSRAQYETFVKLAPGTAAEPLAARYRPLLREDRVRLRTVADDRQDLTDALTRLSDYLGLVGLTALLLGGLGVASAAHVLVRRKLDTIAVFRCLGATAGEVFAVYLLQAAAMALVGSAVGAALGVVVQQLLPGVLRDLLPVDVAITPSLGAIGKGLVIGVAVALAFALLPLLAIRRVPPLAALRRDVEPLAAARRDRARWAAGALIAAGVVALAALEVGSWRRGAAFAAGVTAALLVLWGAAWLAVRLLRRRLPAAWPFAWRQGLANLHRPANQTATVVLAVGFGAFLLATLLLVQHTLLRQLATTGGPRRPNLALLDIQPDQVRAVDSLLTAAGLPAPATTPIVPMRIQSVKGRPIGELIAALADTGARPGQRSATGERRGGRGSSRDAEPENAWAFRYEYRATYRDTLVATERLVAGRWWNAHRRTGPAEVSLDRSIAPDLGIKVGDEIVWDVQGLSVPTRVASLREVDWARFEPNFLVVFSPGALEQAPQTLVALVRVTDPLARGALQRRLAERFANVSSVDLAQVQQALERLVDRVVLAIRFMALFTLVTGAVVLVGAVATTRDQRVREGALLRTLGATRGQVLRVVLAEYLALGVVAALVGVVLALAAGWALARWLFETPFAFPAVPLAALAALVAGGAAVVGLSGSSDVVRRTPLEVLRAE
jgi:putative ABC transport system permease protein